MLTHGDRDLDPPWGALGSIRDSAHDYIDKNENIHDPVVLTPDALLESPVFISFWRITGDPSSP